MKPQPETPYVGRYTGAGPAPKGNLAITAVPATEPISTVEAKKHLRVDFSEDDAYIAALITAARRYCEKVQGRAYITQTATYSLDDIPGVGNEITLPVKPIISIDSITIAQKDTTAITIDANFYDTDLQGGKIVLNDDFTTEYDADLLPLYNAFVITLKAGYGATAADVPAEIKHAMFLIIGHWYEHREDASDGKEVKQIPLAAAALLQIDRNFNL
jgi:uncharacterized phiE125 gp8 family phage protein